MPLIPVTLRPPILRARVQLPTALGMERPEVRVAAPRTCIPEGHPARCRAHAVGRDRMAGLPCVEGPEVTRAEGPQAASEIPPGLIPGVTEVACTTKKRLWTSCTKPPLSITRRGF